MIPFNLNDADEVRHVEQRRTLSAVERRVLDAMLCALCAKARKRQRLPSGVVPIRTAKIA